MTDAERAQVVVTARLLEAAGRFDPLSTGLTLIAAGALLFAKGNPLPLVAALLLGVVAKVYAVRIALDAKLFRDAGAGTIATADLDAALVTLGLKPPGKMGRTWTARCLGAKKLIVICGLATIAQSLAFLAALPAFFAAI